MTHSLADWVAVVSFAAGVHASYCVPYFLTVDADLADFDPRPTVARAVHRIRLAVESGDWDAQLIAVTNARHAVHAAVHLPVEAVRDAVALLILLTTSPKGAMA